MGTGKHMDPKAPRQIQFTEMEKRAPLRVTSEPRKRSPKKRKKGKK